MPKKRCVEQDIVGSDAFTEMNFSSQCLYMQLMFSADDEGFVNSPKKIARSIRCTEEDLQELLDKKFILMPIVESGVVVIKHWATHNNIRADRLKPTKFVEEKALLTLKEDIGYSLTSHSDDNCQSNVSQMTAKVNISKVNSIKDKNIKKSLKEEKKRYGYFKNVLLTDGEFQKLTEEFPTDWGMRIERLGDYIESKGKKYKSHFATIRNWARMDAEAKPKEEGLPVYDTSSNVPVDLDRLKEIRG